MENTKKIAGIASSALLLSGMSATAVVAVADAAEAVQPEDSVEAVQQVEVVGAECVRLDEVKGTFAFAQGIADNVEAIARAMGAAQYLCGAEAAGGDVADAGDWKLTVKGAVENAFTASMDDMAEEGKAHLVMGCSCAGNPADGLASIDADVTGITLEFMMEQAGVSPEANTVVVASSDGYEVALPLSYVTQRASMVVYAINGEEVANSVGGVNQLWLGSTSARYFVRNVESIIFEVRDEAPAAPGTPEANDVYANVPNIGVNYGGTAEA